MPSDFIPSNHPWTVMPAHLLSTPPPIVCNLLHTVLVKKIFTWPSLSSPHHPACPDVRAPTDRASSTRHKNWSAPRRDATGQDTSRETTRRTARSPAAPEPTSLNTSPRILRIPSLFGKLPLAIRLLTLSNHTNWRWSTHHRCVSIYIYFLFRHSIERWFRKANLVTLWNYGRLCFIFPKSKEREQINDI